MKKYATKPFALVGVNIDHDSPEKLKAVMTKEKLTWRSFAGRGAIFEQWNYPATPTMYLLDRSGVIRKKWVGNPTAESLKVAIENWIRHAETARDTEPSTSDEP